jgi:hypothetical protein
MQRDADPRALATEFDVEASLLVNEGGVQCTAVVFARPVPRDAAVELGENAYLDHARVAGLDPTRAAQRGPGVVAFVLEDPMDARSFAAGDRVRLVRRQEASAAGRSDTDPRRW